MRNVFFSFHYEEDIFRANIVRNAWVAAGGADPAGYRDWSMWEEARTRNDRRLERMIANALDGSSVTAVLIGQHTAARDWVMYEIEESWRRGNGLLGVYIHQVRDLRTGRRSPRGANPFQGLLVEGDDAEGLDLGDIIATYDWEDDDGFSNLGSWVERAAREAGR